MTRQKQRVATDTWRSLGCRTTPLEHWSKRKATVKPRWVKQQTKFAPLCRLNYRFHGIESFIDLWSSLIVFSNISENKITLTKVHWNLKVRAETGSVRNGKHFQLQNRLTLLSRLWTSRSKSKKAQKMIPVLTCCLRRYSKSVVIFRKMHFLRFTRNSQNVRGQFV